MAQITLNSTGVASSGSLVLQTNGTTSAVTVDASQNVGIGVTPSAWYIGNSTKAFELGSGSIWSYSTTALNMIQNGYINSSLSYIYKTTAAASYYVQAGGAHQWYNAPSGTAGNTISFTQAMTLDASGNLCVGTTTSSPITSRISVSANGLIVGGGTFPAVCVQDSTDSTYFSHFSQNNADTYLFNTANGTMRFGTNDTERARIDSSGNLLVGTTTALAKTTIYYNGAATNGIGINDQPNTSNTTYAAFYSGALTGSIDRVGSTNAVAYNTTSDYRLKTVTGAVTGQGARIDALKPINYLWTEGGQQASGFLAHEFQTVYPNSVSGDKDAVDADGKPKYQVMQAATSEVIADLIAEIQSLRQRLAAANL